MRLQSGLAGEEMTGEAGFFSAAPLKALGEWTSYRRILVTCGVRRQLFETAI
jgi:hypothetical protein